MNRVLGFSGTKEWRSDIRSYTKSKQQDWRELPGLVKDGCAFSYEQACLFAAWLKEQQRGAPADAGLKRALADNEDGGTAYEERAG